jgi:hypothetical protein
MIYIGIDPGAAGGIAALDDRGRCLEVVKMPGTVHDVLEYLWQFEEPENTRAALEHVWSIPGQGGAFAFGKSVGHLEMALAACAIPFDQVLPRTWQKAIGVHYPKEAGDTIKKNITKRRAQQLFPRLTITHATADALLLAEHCRRVHHGRKR